MVDDAVGETDTARSRPIPEESEASGASGDLRVLQAWFQDEIFRPNALPETPPEPGHLAADELILPSATLAAEERVRIYTRMFLSRSEDALREDFPTVARHVGEQEFRSLVRRYLSKHPPRHFSLNRLGAIFPTFLSAESESRPELRYSRDIARVEQTLLEVFHDDWVPPLDPRGFQSLGAIDWANLKLRTVRSLRILETEFPAFAAIEAARRGDPLPPAVAGPYVTAVYRRGQDPWRIELTREERTILERLAAGASIGESLEAAATLFPNVTDEAEDRIFAAFGSWVASGLFEAIIE
jgi:hypothetical protein